MLLPCAAGVAALAGPPPESRAEERHAVSRSMDAAPRFEAELTTQEFAAEDASGASIMGRFFMTLKRSKFIALRSCPELEPDAFPHLASLHGKPAVPLGLLPPRPDGARSAEDDAIMECNASMPRRGEGACGQCQEDARRRVEHGVQREVHRLVYLALKVL
ncbi:hypothetical protein ZWY2020_053793 [Hordeum vulgare]|nr:hypothetical protein ZWY2020_053793 [Hordeum vulgare]